MDWKDRYKAALVETDPSKLLSLITDAEIAMSSRSESLPTVTKQEMQEIGDATWTLRLLKSHAQTDFARTTLEKPS